jgi:DNA repair protein RecN (Recombination protein N)
MLLELNIEHFAVVDQLRVRFRTGLNLLTGETGSGKSIVVDALSLLLGARASSDLIRPGCKRARISGIFEVDTLPLSHVTPIEMEDAELIVEREILESGKSRAYVNGRVVTLADLRELAAALGDIHGQHEQQSLFSPKAQLEMLDAFAGTAPEARDVGQIYKEWRTAQTRLEELRGNEQERLRLLDLYRFQHREISEANLEPGQDDELARESNVLNNIERIKATASRAYDALYDSAGSVTAQLAAAKRDIEELSNYDSAAAAWAEPLAGARASVEDVAFELRSYLERLESNPQRLADIEDRLAVIENLKRKYGPTLAEVIAYGAEVERRLADIESNDEQIEQAEQRKGDLGRRYQDLAGTLSKKRGRAGKRLKSLVEKELSSLAMEKSVFEVDFEDGEQAAWSASGVDKIRFLISANPGQPARPLATVASGGELSRVTLALKTCLLPALSPKQGAIPRTLVFDEIDTGVGGRVAESVGRRLQELARSHQVLCVTHLPQVAGFADAHYFVEKRGDKKKTFATIAELSEPERVAELARMLSGESVTASAVEHAQEILKSHRRAAV